VIKTITNEFIIVTTWPKINLSCPSPCPPHRGGQGEGHPVALQYWLKHKACPRMSISGDAGFPSPIKAFEDKLKDCGNDNVWDFGSIESI